MIRHSSVTDSQVRSMIRSGTFRLAGNAKLKIYGRFNCKSGKRMKRENRVFFESAEEAIANGFRPCGNCMRQEYRRIKRSH